MMDANSFRQKLAAVMPGYAWTVHRQTKGGQSLTATGIQSSGFNRLSTLEVRCSTKNGVDWYTARSAGFGRRAEWLHENGDVTLARALRGLQTHYQDMANKYLRHARDLEAARPAAVTKAMAA
jgi:hypothetical protein